MNLILLGFKGCGKTHFGARLSQRTHRTFIDSDQLIETLYAKRYQEEKSCRLIYQTKGNSFFRELEREVVLSLKGCKNSVISLGGGTVIDPRNLTLIRRMGHIVYLKLTREKALERMVPHLGQSDQIYEQRKKIYEKIAQTTIELEGKKEEEILQLLEEVHDGE